MKSEKNQIQNQMKKYYGKNNDAFDEYRYLWEVYRDEWTRDESYLTSIDKPYLYVKCAGMRYTLTDFANSSKEKSDKGHQSRNTSKRSNKTKTKPRRKH